MPINRKSAFAVDESALFIDEIKARNGEAQALELTLKSYAKNVI